jgi:hypothetical protein
MKDGVLTTIESVVVRYGALNFACFQTGGVFRNTHSNVVSDHPSDHSVTLRKRSHGDSEPLADAPPHFPLDKRVRTLSGNKPQGGKKPPSSLGSPRTDVSAASQHQPEAVSPTVASAAALLSGGLGQQYGNSPQAHQHSRSSAHPQHPSYLEPAFNDVYNLFGASGAAGPGGQGSTNVHHNPLHSLALASSAVGSVGGIGSYDPYSQAHFPTPQMMQQAGYQSLLPGLSQPGKSAPPPPAAVTSAKGASNGATGSSQRSCSSCGTTNSPVSRLIC